MLKQITAALCATITLLFCSFSHADAPTIAPEKLQPDNLFPQVKMITSMGTIVVELDRPKAPLTVDNFLKYVVTGEYDNTVFHRVIEGFVVQGGGMDEKYNALDDLFGSINNEAGNGLKNETYTLAMARQAHPHSAARQFFFNMNDNDSLDPGRRSWGYTVFGSIVEGEEVVENISKVKTNIHAELGWSDVPVTPVKILEVILLPPAA